MLSFQKQKHSCPWAVTGTVDIIPDKANGPEWYYFWGKTQWCPFHKIAYKPIYFDGKNNSFTHKDKIIEKPVGQDLHCEKGRLSSRDIFINSMITEKRLRSSLPAVQVWPTE